MNFAIRRLLPEELEMALTLAWETFLQFEAPDYGPEGTESFRKDIIENPAFHESCRQGWNRMWGAFDGEKLVGIFAMRCQSHICLVFTHREYHRKGIATAIFRQLIQDIKQENPELSQLTLNSSPYGIPFYHYVGFRDVDAEQILNGIRYTPMIFDL